jgi:hypothetical protein
MTTEINKPRTYEFHSGAFQLMNTIEENERLLDMIKDTSKHKETKQSNKNLPISCINDFADLISMHLTSGEVTPEDFISCFVAAIKDELTVQQNMCDSLGDILKLLKDE